MSNAARLFCGLVAQYADSAATERADALMAFLQCARLWQGAA